MDDKESEMQIEYKTANESAVSGNGEGLSAEEYTRRERAVVWKLDCFIAPVMMILMLISYLDRGNVRVVSFLDCQLPLLICSCYGIDWLCCYTGSVYGYRAQRKSIER
jgi:hypothetical protein